MAKRRIMIVEDDQDMIELLSLILRRGGYEPIAALGGEEALRLLRADGVELVLLDLMMGDMSGWDVLDTMKTDDTLCNIPVLIVSARHHTEEIKQVAPRADWIKSYLVKPFAVGDLLSQIGEALQ